MTNKARLSTAFFLLSFFIDVTASAQRLDSLLNDTEVKYPQEKIHVQYDKPYYNPGETIWFKAYLYPSNFPYTISSTVYSELINEKGAVLQRKVMPVIANGASSSFEIPDSLKAGVIYVRAYTAWMLNFDSGWQYLKPIRIISKSPSKAKVAENYNINFFPEGGDLIAGIPSQVAFKAINQDAEPYNVSGTIAGKDGKTITTFTSTHDGMGKFMLAAEGGEFYKAIWKDKKGKLRETQLPIAKAMGVTLSVSQEQGLLKYTIERAADAGDDFKSLTVIAQMQQQLTYSAKINLTAKTKITAPIATDSLADGILQLTIFDSRQIPVAQRLVFINNGNYFFNTDLHAVELNPGKRKRNVLQIDVSDTIFTNLSISVTDESLTGSGLNKENIFSEFLLSSDLKGNIYNAAQYFVSDEDSLKQQLDLVMLTNGWRRFKWEDLVAGKVPAIKYFPERNLSISGTVYGPSKLLLKDKSITGILKTKSGGSEFIMIPVNHDGTFKVDQLMLFDTAKLYYQFNNDKDKRLTNSASFNFNSPYQRETKVAPLLLNSTNLPEHPDSATERKSRLVAEQVRQQFFEGNKIKELNTVVVKARIKSPEQKMDEEYTSGLFTGGDGYTFIIDTDPFAKNALTVLDYLKSKVAGLQISTTGDASISWRGSPTSLFLNETPTEVTSIQSMPMSDVAIVKVFRPPFFGVAGGGAGGAVAVYLKKGADMNNNVKGLDFVNIAGYSPIKEFYSPDYEKLSDAGNTDDYRTTLYWNPTLYLDKSTRRIKIPFFNNDHTKKVRVVVEGINRQGKFTREEKVF